MADDVKDPDAQELEILRLRDLLIAKDAELGNAQGRLAEYEASSLHSAAAIAARLRQLTPNIIWKAVAALRRTRG
jgi:hypothetical protein